MKILIISRHTFPMQSPRAFRTAELSEELSRLGHDVLLYTVQGKYDYSEYEKETGVTMRSIKTRWATSASDGSMRHNIIDRLMFHFFHRILFFPEIEFKFCVSDIIKENPYYDLLITIAYPHSIHMGAARAKKKYSSLFPKTWIADCGDPFFNNPFIKFPRYMEKYERGWCEAVDYITVPTEGSKDGYFAEYRDKIRVIPQGFDFSKTPVGEYKKNDIPTFIFCGSVYPGKRDVRSFMDFLLARKEPFKFKLMMKSPLDAKYEVESNHQIEYIIGKDRKEVIMECSKADFLINVINPNRTQTPSKLIDYGISGRPVLNISNDFCEHEEFEEFCAGDYHQQLVLPDLKQYKIINVAKQFLSLA